MARCAVDSEVGGDFANHADEFKAMPRTGRDDDKVGQLGMNVEDEMTVGRVGKDARFERLRRPDPIGKIAFTKFAQDAFIILIRFAFKIVGVNNFFKVMIAREFKARNAELRKAVIASFFDEHLENGKVVELKI